MAPPYLVKKGSGILLNSEVEGGALAVGVAPPNPGSNQPYRTCCGGKCGCMCNVLPSSWTLEFHDCTHEQACLNGMTFTIDRALPTSGPTGYPVGHECGGYVHGSYICEGGTGHVKWIGVNMNDFGWALGLGGEHVYSVSIGMDSDQTFFGIPLHVYNGKYSIAGYLLGDPAREQYITGTYARWDCVGQSGTITQSGSLMYFAFDFLHWGFSVDVTPNP